MSGVCSGKAELSDIKGSSCLVEELKFFKDIMPGVPEDDGREDRERRKYQPHKLWVREAQSLTHCTEVVPWGDKSPEECLKSRQRGVQYWQSFGAPRTGWESRGMNKSRSQEL